MSDYPYRNVKVDWKRPPIDKGILKQCTARSDAQALWHCLGVLGVLATTGSLAYYGFATQRWLFMAIALYVHGALFAFNPQTHEFSHGAVFKTNWLNLVFKRVFGLLHWTSNGALYRMSHLYHHRYTLHRQSDGEEVHPRPEFIEQLLYRAIQVVDLNGIIATLYDQIDSLCRPHLRNPRRSVWQRYVYANSTDAERRDAYATRASQLLFHLIFATIAVATGHGFLVVVVTLPQFYGGTWYHMLVHDTMHVGKTPETDDFRACCRTVWLDPFTSFMYWHMEWHVEHHSYAGIPCYNLRKFHRLTREHWDPPQSLTAAWREMDAHSRRLLLLGDPPQ